MAKFASGIHPSSPWLFRHHVHPPSASALGPECALYLAADTGRHWDARLAFVYYRTMTQKGKCHQQSVMEVAIHLLWRLARIVPTGVFD